MFQSGTLSTKPQNPSRELDLRHPKKPTRVCTTYSRLYITRMLNQRTDVAKDNDASLGTRATATKDMIGDKADEKKHEVCLYTLGIFLVVLIIVFTDQS